MTNKIFSLRAIEGGRAVIQDAPRSAKTDDKKSNTSIKNIISHFIGDFGPLPLEVAMLDQMAVYAREHGGDFDKETATVTFEGEEGELTVHGFIQTTAEDNDYIEYQALLRTADPIRYYAGKPDASFFVAIENIKMK